MQKNKCLQCEKHPIIRGLCRAHYAQFDKIKKAAEASGADIEAFEDDLISKGLVLPDLDLKNGWAEMPRNKTGKTRRARLWPATIQSLGSPSEGLIFRTRHGNPWRSDAIAQEFRKLVATHLSDNR